MKALKFFSRFIGVSLLAVSTACATYTYKSPPRTNRPAPTLSGHFQQVGLASWYGPGFYGRKTASGEKFKKNELTCAHRTLPFGTRLLVKNLENDRTVEVRVNDRGPFIRNKIVDLSYAAAKEIGMFPGGSTKVELKTLIAEEDRFISSVADIYEDYFGPTKTDSPQKEEAPSAQDSAQSIKNLIEGLEKR